MQQNMRRFRYHLIKCRTIEVMGLVRLTWTEKARSADPAPTRRGLGAQMIASIFGYEAGLRCIMQFYKQAKEPEEAAS
jgi:hypothetical protein